MYYLCSFCYQLNRKSSSCVPLLHTVQKKLTGSVVLQFSLRSCLQGPDKDSRLHAPPANNVNKDPQPHADVACSSTGGAAGSNGHIFPTWRPARRNPPRSFAVQHGLHSSRGTRHTSCTAQQLADITKAPAHTRGGSTSRVLTGAALCLYRVVFLFSTHRWAGWKGNL